MLKSELAKGCQTNNLEEARDVKDLPHFDNESSCCAGCLNLIDDEEVIEALDSEWHVDCFRSVRGLCRLSHEDEM